MKKWSKRLCASAAVAAGAMALCAGPSLAKEPGPSASSNGRSASASAAKVGPVAISESSVGQGQRPQWSAARVGDTVVLGKDSKGWTGAAAAAGDSIDRANRGLCPRVVDVGGSVRGVLCLQAMPSHADGYPSESWAYGALVYGILYVHTQSTDVIGTELMLAPSSANQTSYECSGYAGSDAALALVLAPTPGGYHVLDVMHERDEATSSTCAP